MPRGPSIAATYLSSVSSDYTKWGQEEVLGGSLHTGGEGQSRIQPSLGVTQDTGASSSSRLSTGPPPTTQPQYQEGKDSHPIT